jgi:predicted peptidase
MTSQSHPAICLIFFGILAFPFRLAAAAETKLNFEAKTHQGKSGQKLPYLLLRPADYKAEAEKKFPLLIFMHGAGERGDDNQAQIRHGKDFLLAATKEYQSFVFAPQCPADAKWVDVNWGAKSHLMPDEPAAPMALVWELLPQLMRELPIDPDRVYVMGLSMGGYATWDMLQRRPELFAAAVPICGGGDVTLVAKFARVPVWAFHGGRDTTVPTSRSRDMIAAMRKVGGEPRYTESPKIAHDEWNVAFKEPELAKWLFAQRREK